MSNPALLQGARSSSSRLFVVLSSLLLAPQVAKAEELGAKALEEVYEPRVRPLLARYCEKCHSAERIEADVDLSSFPSWLDVRRHPETWQKIGEMLESGQMPPRASRQPTDAERAQLREWVRGFLTFEAKARAGDPGRVVLRRLSNAEYTYTLRDLTSVGSLDPAREFPVDGAAGEGFTNTGNALVMSPSLVTKYLDAAKEVAAHAVLLPDGFRFSPGTTRRDWTDEYLKQIRDFYGKFTEPLTAEQVNRQGSSFKTNDGGRLPLARYFAAALTEREALATGSKTLETVASEHGLNARYLATLGASLSSTEPSLFLDGLRARWRVAKTSDAAALAEDVAQWQQALWKFGKVGHIGKIGGPKRWLERVDPLANKYDIRVKIPTVTEPSEVTLTLVASDAGDGNEHDFVVWRQPRWVVPGRPDLLLRDVREVTRDLSARRERMFRDTAKHLNAIDEAAGAQGRVDVAELARKHGIEAGVLQAWLDYFGIGEKSALQITGHLTNALSSVAGFDFVRGWGGAEAPNVLANSSEQSVRIPGNVKPRSLVIHPSAKLQAVVGWRSPVTATIRAEAKVLRAHPDCGNGVTWSLELRRGMTRQQLTTGNLLLGTGGVQVGPMENLSIQSGDLVSLRIGSREGNPSCDLTEIEFRLVSSGEGGKTWNLTEDVSGDILAGNPHSDRLGNQGVWHFYTEPETGDAGNGAVIPTGSLLARWQTANGTEERQRIAGDLQKLLASGPPSTNDSPDAVLHRQLTSLGGPLLNLMLRDRAAERQNFVSPPGDPPGNQAAGEANWGLDPSMFGKHPIGTTIDEASLCVRAPSVIEMRFPADLVAGCEFVTTGELDKNTGAEGSVQLQVIPSKLDSPPVLYPRNPIVTHEGSHARKRVEASLEEFRLLFPAALCYTQIVPVDEAVTLTLLHREDDQLVRLMLKDEEQHQLNQLWDKLRYVSQDALTTVDVFAQLMEFATQDADPKVFEPLRKPINDRAAAFRQLLIDTEPLQLNALVVFAARAYRRSLTDVENRELRSFYGRLREQEIPHDEAFRLTLARVLVAPAFLYRIEKPVEGTGQGPISDWELASRLSYFLWSSLPDEELLQAAAAGQLKNPDTLTLQTRRMLQDARTRRLATEFACQWLHIYDFDHLDEKSERHFPTFVSLRGAMYEESIQFFSHLFQLNGSVLDLLDADYTFLNEELAKHYEIPGVSGTVWRRVDGVKKFSRGGILAQATTLSKQSGASRTSPILRGNWVSEVLLGERLPRPPKGVPQLPEDETATEGLTVRQLVEKHSSDAKCVVCHQRIDAFGFSLEGFDAIGRRREKDLGDRRIDTQVKAMDGTQFEGLAGLRGYLLGVRGDAFLRQFCRKLLGYALGRSVQLSDEPLLAEIQSELKTRDYRVVSAVEAIVRSRQFREIRGRDMAYNE